MGPVTGVATKLGFSFPHVSIFLDIPDENGNVKNHMMSIRWTPTVLRKIGWSRKTIVPGDKLTVTYIPHKKNANVGALTKLTVNGKELAIVPASSAHEANVRAEIK